MKTYYAVHGENGLGVYQNYHAVMKSKEYLSKFNCKKFSSIDEARLYAVSKYNEHQEEGSPAIADPSMPLKVNWLFFRRDVIAHNNTNKQAAAN